MCTDITRQHNLIYNIFKSDQQGNNTSFSDPISSLWNNIDSKSNGASENRNVSTMISIASSNFDTRRQLRRVTFDERPPKINILSPDIEDDHMNYESRNKWYSKAEYAEIRAENRRTADRQSEGYDEDNLFYCYRGLEHMSRRLGRKRMATIIRACDALLSEQQRQDKDGIHDPDLLATTYQKCTKGSQLRASRRGYLDHQSSLGDAFPIVTIADKKDQCPKMPKRAWLDDNACSPGSGQPPVMPIRGSWKEHPIDPKCAYNPHDSMSTALTQQTSLSGSAPQDSMSTSFTQQTTLLGLACNR